MVGGVKSHLESNPIPTRNTQRAQTNLCCTRTQRPYETETELCLSISCGGTCQQWTAAGAWPLGAEDLVWHKPSWKRSPLSPPESPGLTQDWETNSSWAQTEPCAH